jgi:HSP20 family protein
LAEPFGGVDPFRMMRELLRWDPFAELAPLAAGGRAAFVPTFEVKETKEGYAFRADLPGVRAEDLDIALTGNRLTVSGKREEEQRDEGERYYAYERSYGTFSRSFTLPEGVDAEHVQCDLKHGVLTLVLPKKPELQPKRIAIKTGKEPKA